MAQVQAVPPHRPFVFQQKSKANPFGAAGSQKAITDVLNWLVTRDNSIHAAGVYSYAGELEVNDTHVDLFAASEQEAFYRELGLRDDVRAFMDASHKVASKTSQLAKTEVVGKDVTAVRLTLDNQKYIGLVPLFRDHSYFLVVTVLDRQGFKSNNRDFVPYVDQRYRDDLNFAREKIVESLKGSD